MVGVSCFGHFDGVGAGEVVEAGIGLEGFEALGAAVVVDGGEDGGFGSAGACGWGGGAGGSGGRVTRVGGAASEEEEADR